MDQSENNSFSVEKPLHTSSGPYTSPPPIGYPTREPMVGDPPAGPVETTSRGVPNAEALDSAVQKGSLSTLWGCCCGDDAAT
ncbi:hypothetical protein CARUB_v10015265mg [Capsella rubella]|uniref:Cysteine-rich transmembrane CYSTM domain-containing protein n=1 Tax=Capsella rubella TaxID=81985 RepID=R0I6J5_9BRAS|nr:hypothetical protein CARUB_v10015265mg [Capsella rubella]